MARQIGWMLAVLLTAGAPAASAVESARCDGQQPQKSPSKQDERRDYREPFDNHPRYAWWKDDKALAAAGFSAEQAGEIARVFKESMEKARPIRDEVMQLQKALNEMIDANVADVALFARHVEKVETKRTELNKLRLVMLYRMHRVLTPEQNTKLLAYFDRREADRKKDADRKKQDGARRN